MVIMYATSGGHCFLLHIVHSVKKSLGCQEIQNKRIWQREAAFCNVCDIYKRMADPCRYGDCVSCTILVCRCRPGSCVLQYALQ